MSVAEVFRKDELTILEIFRALSIRYLALSRADIFAKVFT